jgi:DNA-binding response OmpR family regulator
VARILVADDDRQTLDLIERALARKGHEVEVFPDGEQACLALAEAEYDLVLTDLRMPSRGGLDVLRASKERRPATPVFLLSGAWLSDERDEAMRLGAHVALLKPIDFRYLYSLIENAMDEQNRMRENEPKIETSPPRRAEEKPPAGAGSSKASESARVTPPDRAAPLQLAAPLVLVAEPDAALRKLLEYCLKRQGFRVTATGVEKDALELAQLEPPDAVLASGAEDDPRAIAFVEALRRDAACARTYVAFLYAEGASADAVHALDAGADVALERPFEPEVLFAHVKAGVRRALRTRGHGGANGNGNGNGNGKH